MKRISIIAIIVSLSAIAWGQDGFTTWFETVCANPEHQKEFPVNPTFEGFIKWLRTQ